MTTKFSSIPVEKDTQILVQQEAKFGSYDVLYQKWYWDGITAESLIFLTDDVSDLCDSSLEKEVKSSPLVKPDSSVTIKRAESGYTFVNFNFETE